MFDTNKPGGEESSGPKSKGETRESGSPTLKVGTVGVQSLGPDGSLTYFNKTSRVSMNAGVAVSTLARAVDHRGLSKEARTQGGTEPRGRFED